MWDRRGFANSCVAGCIIAACLFLSGCQKAGGRPVYPVKGQVFVESKPATGALVILRPVGEPKPEEWTAGFPRAEVAADGSFEVSTYGVRDGAPPGEYIVLVKWQGGSAGEDPEAAASAGDRLGSRYADPAISKLRAKVEETTNELPRFDLQ